jgi:hypothetical protein
MRRRKDLGNVEELLLRPLKNIDISVKGCEGMHQLRLFRDVTKDRRSAGIFVLLANQHQRDDTPLQPHHVAWFTGNVSKDAVPIQFIDLDKVYYAFEEAKRMQAEFEKEQHESETDAGTAR